MNVADSYKPGEKWWVCHGGWDTSGLTPQPIECEKNWLSKPFNTKAEAEAYRDTLLNPHSCPGCGQPTPTNGHYTVLQPV